MVANGGYDVVAGPDNAADREIQRVAAVKGKDDVRRFGRVDDARYAAAGPLDDPIGLDGFTVRTAAVGRADLALVAIDGFVDRFRLGPGRGGVIEIYPASLISV